jgi:hypothetical protein
MEDLKGVELLSNEEGKSKQEEAIEDATEAIDKGLKLFNTMQFDF